METVLMRLMQLSLTETFGEAAEDDDVARIAKDASDDNEKKLVFDVDLREAGYTKAGFGIRIPNPPPRGGNSVQLSEPVWDAGTTDPQWKIIVGINPQMNASRINRALGAIPGATIWDKNFSSPYKRYGGKRINTIFVSNGGPKKNAGRGREARERIAASLRAAGFDISSTPLAAL